MFLFTKKAQTSLIVFFPTYKCKHQWNYQALNLSSLMLHMVSKGTNGSQQITFCSDGHDESKLLVCVAGSLVAQSWFLCHSDLLQQISREVAQLASSADLQVAAFLVSFLHHNLKHGFTHSLIHNAPLLWADKKKVRAQVNHSQD